jgi:hypothetical protein
LEEQLHELKNLHRKPKLQKDSNNLHGTFTKLQALDEEANKKMKNIIYSLNVVLQKDGEVEEGTKILREQYDLNQAFKEQIQALQRKRIAIEANIAEINKEVKKINQSAE